MPTIDDATKNMIVSHQELNGDIDELYEASISPLDFLRYVYKNRPFVLRKGCSSWPAIQRWSSSYLNEVIGDTRVKIAITPRGSV